MFILNLIFTYSFCSIKSNNYAHSINTSCSLIMCCCILSIKRWPNARVEPNNTMYFITWESVLQFWKSMASFPRESKCEMNLLEVNCMSLLSSLTPSKKAISTKFKFFFFEWYLHQRIWFYFYRRALHLYAIEFERWDILSDFACVLRVIININYMVDDGQSRKKGALQMIANLRAGEQR